MKKSRLKKKYFSNFFILSFFVFLFFENDNANSLINTQSNFHSNQFYASQTIVNTEKTEKNFLLKEIDNMNLSKSNSLALLHFIIIIWGFTGILGKIIDLTSIVIVLYRMIIASAALF